MNRLLLAALTGLFLAQPVFAQAPSNSLENDLNSSSGALITRDQIDQINASISKLRAAAEQTMTPEVVGAPDYRDARDKLQAVIGAAIINYLSSMEQINAQIIPTLQTLASLANQTSDLSDQLMQNEMNRLIPGVNAKINQIYKGAIEKLYLTNYYTLNVTKGHVKRVGHRWLNPLKEYDASKSGTYSSSPCITGACELQIAKDLNEWFSFVGTLNRTISIVNYKTNSAVSNRSLYPFVTEAFLTAFKEMTTGPKPNVSYNLGGYMVQLMKIPTGYASKISLVPMFIFEKTARLAVKIWNTHFIKFQLVLNAVHAYSPKVITQAVNRQQKDIASTRPAVLYGDQIKIYNDNRLPFTVDSLMIIDLAIDHLLDGCTLVLRDSGLTQLYVNQQPAGNYSEAGGLRFTSDYIELARVLRNYIKMNACRIK